MFVTAVKKAEKAMFPIFSWKQVAENQVDVGVAGTGFFINNQGYFISVTHIFDMAEKGFSYKYWGQLPEKVINPFLDIKEIARDDNMDIFIGKINTKVDGFLKLSKNIPEIGKSVCVSGYPLAHITNNNQGGLELGGVRRYFQPSFVLDRAVMNSKGNSKIRKHDGFLVRDFGLFGMSGGPVIDINGIAVGIQASVTKPRKSTNGRDREIIIENALVIRSNLILDLLSRNKIKT